MCERYDLGPLMPSPIRGPDQSLLPASHDGFMLRAPDDEGSSLLLLVSASSVLVKTGYTEPHRMVSVLHRRATGAF